MPLQNRVTPTSDIIVHQVRGLFMGNRGILHDEASRLGTARWRHPHWIACLTAFMGRRRVPMTPRRYTELFFLDEAVALAAGHRPCAECRRDDWQRFLAAWRYGNGDGVRGAADLDRTLHEARLLPRRRFQRRHEADIATLPDGAFIAAWQGPCLVHGDRLLPWSPGGYGAALRRPATGTVTVLTPAPVIATMRAGYAPVLHSSARA
ncbi:MAG: hypothetical protein EXQ97_06405 [Alphaproteobacteria bacterium]|nr:hypothetical protein [Alphaproteobacteria bacterium]